MKISGGIYLIADMQLEKVLLLAKLSEALKSGISVVQIYNTKNKSQALLETINEVCTLCQYFSVPVLVNNDWRLLKETRLNGVHFDKIPEDYNHIKNSLNKDFLKGVTCSNNLQAVQCADNHRFDYISFCSMFPSRSAGSCELVSFETVKEARLITNLPFFVAGGINLENINQLTELPINGIAVISGIMASANISSSTLSYKNELAKLLSHEN